MTLEEERLENMEREVGRQKRRNRWLLAAIVLVAGGLIVPLVFETMAFRARAQGAGTAKEIRANSFVLEDENGKIRAVLGKGKNGPMLSLIDENEKNRAVLSVSEVGPMLSLIDENEKDRISLWAGVAGPNLSLSDKNGEGRISLWATEVGPSLLLSDENGKMRFAAGKRMAVSPDGKTIEYPESSLILYGPDGKVIWRAIK